MISNQNLGHASFYERPVFGQETIAVAEAVANFRAAFRTRGLLAQHAVLRFLRREAWPLA